MQNEMDLLNRHVAESDLPSINMGIGVNYGPVVVGNIGSETRKKYGIVGAAVNVTQRIQGQSGGGEVVISETVYDKVKSDVIVDRQISATLKGVASAVKLYAIKPHPARNRKI
jgi:class 3 adenylate cyclase